MVKTRIETDNLDHFNIKLLPLSVSLFLMLPLTLSVAVRCLASKRGIYYTNPMLLKGSAFATAGVQGTTSAVASATSTSLLQLL